MNILVIGNEGYIGVGLSACLGRRHRVFGWSRSQNLLKLHRSWLEQQEIDLVVNCAAVMERQGTVYNVAAASHQVNVEGVAHLVNIMKGTAIRLIQISTKDVFGQVYTADNIVDTVAGYRPRFLVNERQPFSPESVYAKSKLMSEYISESHPRASVIRLSTCYTEMFHWRGNWMMRFIRNALKGDPLDVTLNGKQFRDPLHVNDLGRLIEAVVVRDAFPLKINAGGGEGNVISLAEFIEAIGVPARVVFVPGGDYGFAFDNGLATSSTGWNPRLLVRERLPEMVRAVRSALSDAGTK